MYRTKKSNVIFMCHDHYVPYLRFTHYMFSNRRFNGNILLDDEIRTIFCSFLDLIKWISSHA